MFLYTKRGVFFGWMHQGMGDGNAGAWKEWGRIGSCLLVAVGPATYTTRTNEWEFYIYTSIQGPEQHLFIRIRKEGKGCVYLNVRMQSLWIAAADATGCEKTAKPHSLGGF